MEKTRVQEDIRAVLGTRYDNGDDYWGTPDNRILMGGPFSTLEALVILHELGLPGDHEAVSGALNRVVSNWGEDGRIRAAPKGAIYPCQTANAARVLCRFGCNKDPRLEQTFNHLLETAHTDGGWRCSKFSRGRGPETEFSNPGVTLFALDAFRFTRFAGEPGVLDRALDTLLDHWEVRRPTGPCHFGIGTLFMQVEYPFFRYNLFYYVYVLSFYPHARQDPRFRSAFQTLAEKREANGGLVVERPHRRLADLNLSRKGAVSVQATRRFDEIEKNMGSTQRGIG